MPPLSEFGLVQRRKKRGMFLMVVSAALIAVSALLRFVPSLDDALSGKPAYVQAFADITAAQMANVLRDQFPILVARDENLNCGSVNQEPTGDSGDSIYVLTYSEGARALCLTVYGVVSDRSGVNVLTIRPEMGRSYGRAFSSPLKVIPLQRNLTTLTPAYLSLLHWRTKLSFSGEIPAHVHSDSRASRPI